MGTRRLHRAMFAIGSDTETLCLAQHECAQAGRNPRDDPALNERLDAGASKFVAYFMRQVQMLINSGVIPVLVFDGDTLPAKKATEADRLAYVPHVFPQPPILNWGRSARRRVRSASLRVVRADPAKQTD